MEPRLYKKESSALIIYFERMNFLPASLRTCSQRSRQEILRNITFFRGILPLPSSRHHLSYDCLEDTREDYEDCSVLRTAVVHNDTHTYMSSS